MEGTGKLVPGVVGATFAGCGSRSEPADSLHHRECKQRGGGTDEDEAAVDADGNVPDLYGPRRRRNLGVVRLHLCRPHRVVRGRRLRASMATIKCSNAWRQVPVDAVLQGLFIGRVVELPEPGDTARGVFPVS